MIVGTMLTALVLAEPAASTTPAVQRPAKARDAAPDGVAVPAQPTDPAEGPPRSEAETSADASGDGPSEVTPEPVGVTAETPAEAPLPSPGPVPKTEGASAPAASAERFTVAKGEGGPPYYGEDDVAALRERHQIPSETPDRTEPARWRCLIADPTCGRSFEVNALAAYTYRGRQGDVSGSGEDPRWSSGRAQYDFWMNLPVITDLRGRTKYTRMTMGPKGGLIFSDAGSTWGNVGMAVRYWLGRGRWAPTVEFSSALTFKIGERSTKNAAVEAPKWTMTRGPVGFTADVGIGLGGFGALVLGGQYDSPLAREDIPEQFRTAAGGAFFVGFRGNILWGAPAAAAVTTHAVTQRTVEAP